MGKKRTPKQKLEARALLRVLLDLIERRGPNENEFFMTGVLVSEACRNYDVNIKETNVDGLLEHYDGNYVQRVVLRTFGYKSRCRGYRALSERRDDILAEIRGR